MDLLFADGQEQSRFFGMTSVGVFGSSPMSDDEMTHCDKTCSCCEGAETDQIFSSLFHEAGRHRHGRPQHHAGISATRHRRDSVLRQETAGGSVSARRGRWTEHRCSVRRAKLLPHAPFDCDSASRAAAESDCAVDLDGFFGLHPSLAPLAPLFHKNELAIVHAAGSPDPTRSHFDAQDFMESGTPGLKATDDGWLNRALETIPEENASPFRAVAMGANLPRMLRGTRTCHRAARREAIQSDGAKLQHGSSRRRRL